MPSARNIPPFTLRLSCTLLCEGSWGTFTYGEPRRVSVSMRYKF